MTRFFLAASAAFIVGCGGGSSGGGGDAAGTDGPGGGADGGDVRDSAPACLSTAAGITVATPGFAAVELASGAPLAQPGGLAFGMDGDLYVANSTSLLNAEVTAGDVLHLEDDGSLTTFLSGDLLRGPLGILFAPGGAVGGPGLLYVSVEDTDEAGQASFDRLLSYDGEALAIAEDVFEPGKMLFGPDGAIYMAARSELSQAAPNPGRLLRWDPAGSDPPADVDLSDAPDGNALGAVTGFTWTAADQLWVATVEDATYTPASRNGVWAIDGDGVGDLFADGLVIVDLAASPDPTGPWGDYVYGSVVGDAARLVRIDPAGVVTDVATGLAPYAVTFGPDGRLYVSDATNARLIALAPCAQL